MEGGALIVNSTDHHEHRSISAFLSYFVYSAEEGGAYEGEPVLLARQCDHAPHRLLPDTNVRHEDDKAKWALYHAKDTLYLAFRGTADSNDVVTDISAYRICLEIGSKEYTLHSGFHDSVKNTYKTIVRHIKHYSKEINCRQLVITGHSLGGANAQVFGLIYDHDAELVECPCLHSIITFAAPQSCKYAPPTSEWQKKCINYIVLNDPVPYVPSFMDHPLTALFVAQVWLNNSYVARIVSAMHNTLLPGTLGTKLEKYHSLTNAILIQSSSNELTHLNPVLHHQHVRDMTWEQVTKLDTSSHKMLFYLGELQTLNLINVAVKNWFDRENACASPQRYSATFRSMISVYMLWTEQIHAIVHPMYAFVFRSLLPSNTRNLLMHTQLLAQGSTYLFIDPNTTAVQLDELKKQYNDMKNNGVSVDLYEPGDYTWMNHISDIRLLLETVHPLAFWERNSGALDHYEKRNLNMKDENGMNAFEAAERIMSTKSHDTPEYRFAEMLLNSRLSVEMDLRIPTEVQCSSNIHDSICALLTLHATKFRQQTFEWNQHLVHLDCGGKGWAVYMCNGTVYIVFHHIINQFEPYHIYDWHWFKRFISEVYETIPSHILQDASLHIIATGHFLGSALAQAFVMQLRRQNVRAITFGAPPLHTRRIEESSEFEKNIINYVREDDPVPLLNQENIIVSEHTSATMFLDEDERYMFRHYPRKINSMSNKRKSSMRHVGTVVHLPGTTSSLTEDSTGKKVYSFQSMESYCDALSLNEEVHKTKSTFHFVKLFSSIRDSLSSERVTPSLDDDTSDHVSICALLALRMDQRLPHERINLKDPVCLLCCSKHCAIYSYRDTLYIVFSSLPRSRFYPHDDRMAFRQMRGRHGMGLDMLMHDASIPIIVTGHNRGGALAQGFVQEFHGTNARAITFGAPPFRTWRIEESSEFEKNIINYVREDDPVPLLNQENITVSEDTSATMFLGEDERHMVKDYIYMINCMSNERKSSMRHVGTVVHLPGTASSLAEDSTGKKVYSLQSMQLYCDALSLNEEVRALTKRGSSMEPKKKAV